MKIERAECNMIKNGQREKIIKIERLELIMIETRTVRNRSDENRTDRLRSIKENG